jgi:membrane associated rhomboid family serine protease
MFPVTDAIRARRFPFVNLALILACIAVFVYELSLGSEREINDFFEEWGAVPKQLTDWLENPSGAEEPATVITSAFVHGGWLHLLGNMLFLWVFGDNVEDALGHILYPVFYVVGAVGAVAAQVAVDTGETIPMVGASGAIAAVLGAYLVLYPKARIGVLFFFAIFPVPAVALIIIWFLLQLFAGIAAIGDAEATQGVAVWAHVGGFVTGLAIMLVLRPFVPRRSLSEVQAPRRFRGWR